MRTQATLLTLIVALAISAGIAAFLLASPEQGPDGAARAHGFERLTQEEVDAGIEHAATHHRAAHRMLLARRGSAKAAKAWLEALPGSRVGGGRMPRPVRIAPRDTVARTRIAEFVRWADDLPREHWTAGAGMGKVVQDLDGSTDAAPIDPDAYRVVGSVEIRIAQAETRVRRQRVPVVVELLPIMRDGADAPAGWRVLDVRAGKRNTFLRAYDDPILVHSGNVDVIAPARSAALARSIAAEAQSRLATMSARYPRVSGAGMAAIWLLESGSRASAVIGSSVPSDVAAAGAGDLHGTAWMDARGEVAVDLRRANSVGDATLRSAIRHALAHVATRGLVGDAPDLFIEGIARYEDRRSVGPPLAGIDLKPLVAEFSRGESGLARLLTASPGTRLDSSSGSNDHLLALVTIAWIEQVHGHDDLVRILGQLEDGTPPGTALSNVLGLDARGVEVKVARWTRKAAGIKDKPARRPGGNDATPRPAEEGRMTVRLRR